MTKAASKFIAAAAFLAALGLLAAGYNLLGAKWPLGSDVPFFVNANTPDTTGELGAVQGAFSTWSSLNPAKLRLSYGGPTGVTAYGYDGTNTICWANTGGGDVLATAYTWFMPGGAILESDLVFNDDHTWQTNGGDYDIETVALHELGHSIGLQHSTTGIMAPYYGGVSRTPDPDAIAGFGAMYGLAGGGGGGGGGDQPPTVAITSPASGATVSGAVSIAASAADDKGVVLVEFFVDGDRLGEDAAAPYMMGWNTEGEYNAAHTLRVVATDTIGQTAAASITVRVRPHAPADFAGVRRNNSSVLLEQHINILTWSAHPANIRIQAYRLYELRESAWVLVAEIDGATFEYKHMNVSGTAAYDYRLAAVDGDGVEGDPAELSIR